VLVLALLTAASGCERDDPIRTYEAPKDPPMPQLFGGPGIKWTLPANWKAVRVTSQMTYASFHVANGLKPLTVSELPPSGAATLPNVNRWENQLGLPPSSEADLGKVVTSIKVDGHDAQWVELTGPDPAPGGLPQQRMLGAIVPSDNRVWFFKLQGPVEKVAQQKDGFFNFITQSVKLPQGANVNPNAAPAGQQPPLPPAHPPVDPAAQQIDEANSIRGVTAMKLPDGWKIDPTPRQMRSATIIVPGKDGAAPAEIVVSKLGGNFGGLKANLDRWRSQVGLPPAENETADKPEELTLDQGPALIYDFQGPEAAGKDRKRQYVFQTKFPNARTTWFFRLIGPHDTVTAAKPAFDAFVRSLKFE
jgi:hypothetical protein